MAAKQPKTALPSVHCVWSLLCSISSIDQERHNISLSNVIDQINVPQGFFDQNKKEKLVFGLPHEIVMLWRRVIPTSVDENEIPVDLSVAFIDPTGKATTQFLTRFSFPAGKRRTYLRLVAPGFFLTEPGDYVYELGYKFPEQEEFVKAGQIHLDVQKMIV